MNQIETIILWGGLLFLLLLPLVLIDLKTWILPNRLNLLLALGGVIQSLITHNPNLMDSCLGAVLSGSLFFLVAQGYKRLRTHDGLGMGDMKLAAAGSLWIGWSYVGVMVLLATSSALVFVTARAIRSRHFDLEQPLPFGPFLALGILGAWLLGHSFSLSG